MKRSKSPLRYPGGKSRAIDHILKYIPASLKTICSPFFGGGSIEIVLAQRGVRVYGYDTYSPLVNFWHYAINTPRELAELAQTHLPIDAAGFKTLQNFVKKSSNNIQRAAAFYVVNRASFSGTTLCGGMSVGHPRFTQSAIDYLAQLSLRNVSVVCADHVAVIARHSEDFLYLDPPYVGRDYLYNQDGAMQSPKNTKKKVLFNHEELATMLKKRSNWILSYGDCPTIRSLYKDFQIIPLQWNYSMNKTKKSNEVLVLSNEL